MAELVLKVGDSENPDGYKDGDILCAFSDHRIACVHLEHICHPKLAVRNKRYILPGTSLVETLHSEGCQYRFEPITVGSKRMLKRITLADSSEEVFDKNPSFYIELRLLHGKKAIFGEFGSGRPYWFGGRVNMTPAKVSNVWDAVELATSNSRTDPLRKAWPMGSREGFEFLYIRSRDFSESRRHEYETADIDETDPDNPIKLARRKYRIDWEADLGLSARSRTDIKDRTIFTDKRLSSLHDDRLVVRTRVRK
jgi:hypothetical protein